MTRLSVLVRHELTRLRRRGVLRWLVGLTVVCAAVVTLSGRMVLAKAQDDESTVRSGTEAAWERLEGAVAAGETIGFGGNAGQVRTTLVLPTPILLDFAGGRWDLLPRTADLAVWNRSDHLFGWYQLQSPWTLAVGRFDWAFFVVWIVPLLVVALGFDILAGDRRQGVLASAVLHGATPGTVLAAASLVRLGLVVAAIVATATTVLAAGGADTERLRAVGPLLLVAIAWAALWQAVVAAVAALGRSLEATAALLIAIWATAVVGIPASIDAIGRVAHPVAPGTELVAAQRTAASEATKARAELLARYLHEHPELGSPDEVGGFLPTYLATQLEIERRIAPVGAELAAARAELSTFRNRSQWVSPASLVAATIEGIVGTDGALHQSFATDARARLARWHAELAPLVMAGREPTTADLARFSALADEPLVSPRVSWWTAVALLVSLTLGLVLWAGRNAASYPVIERRA